MPCDESNLPISKDAQTFYFVADNADEDLYKANWSGTEVSALTDRGVNPYSVRLNPAMDALYMMQSGGQISRYQLESDKLESLPFSARMKVNHTKQREQIFEEVWRKLDTNFYDPNFHGQDWQQLHDHYKPWALQTSTDRDFEDVVNMMLGELNASHMG